MVNKKFLLGMLALVLTFGLTVAGCDDDKEEDKSGGGGKAVTITVTV